MLSRRMKPGLIAITTTTSRSRFNASPRKVADSCSQIAPALLMAVPGNLKQMRASGTMREGDTGATTAEKAVILGGLCPSPSLEEARA